MTPDSKNPAHREQMPSASLGKTEALEQIRSAANRFVQCCDSASDAEWKFRPEPGAWCMADVAEHVTLANERVLSRLKTNALDEAKPSVIDEEIPYLFYQGDEPPTIASPTGAFIGDRQSVKRVAASAQAIRDWGEAERSELRSYCIGHPVFGMLDRVQWLLFVGAHTERHRAQLIGLLRRQRHARQMPSLG